MVNATLGGLLKDFRIQKGISQFDIALALGWSETSRLSRIEQGKVVRPSRETLEKIIEVMGLSEVERNSLLFIGKYLPTDEEMVKVRISTDKVLEDWPYPATVLDFSWRVVNQNDQIAILYQLPPEAKEKVLASHPRAPELIINYINLLKQYLPENEMGHWVEFYKFLLMHYRFEQKDQTKEKWFKDYLKKMMKQPLFAQSWKEIQRIEDQTPLLKRFVKTSLSES